MANNYLDKTGLIYLWGKIKAALAVKSNTDHTHNYAGSSSAGGAANSATLMVHQRLCITVRAVPQRQQQLKW